MKNEKKTKLQLIEEIEQLKRKIDTLENKCNRSEKILAKNRQKMPEDDRKKSKGKYQTLVENINDVIFIVDANGYFTYFSPVIERISLYKAEEITGMHFSQFVHPDDLPNLTASFKKTLSGISEEFEFRALDKNGKSIFVRTSSRPLYEKGKLLGLTGIMTDFTPYKQAQEDLLKFKLGIERSGEAIFITDTEGKILYVNPAFEKIYGYSKDEALGKTPRILKSGVLVPEVYKRFWDMLIRKNIITGEFVNKTKDGQLIHIEGSANPLLNQNDEIIGFLAIQRDITDRKRTEEELIKAKKLESLSLLAGGIAHDFNNMLATILGNVSLARMKMSPKDKNFERLIKAEKGCLRARDLTHKLLTFSRGGAPVKNPTSIAELLKESIVFFLRGSNVKCESIIPDELWPVEVDETQIHQVINNLIVNAEQSMPDGGIIKVQAENIIVENKHGLPLKNGNYVRIIVQDQGVGIAKEHLPKIFDPYFTTKQKGAGLGLTTAYSIVKRHEGYITVESKEDIGTTMYVYLPASEKGILKKKPERERPVHGKGKILIMDDEDDIREVLSQMLINLGYEVASAKDGTEATRVYKKNIMTGTPFDLVIMDLTIPGGMGGKNTIAKLKKIDPLVRAIASSGYSNDPILSDYKKYGFSDVIAKPYNIEKLSVVVHNLIKG